MLKHRGTSLNQNRITEPRVSLFEPTCCRFFPNSLCFFVLRNFLFRPIVGILALGLLLFKLLFHDHFLQRNSHYRSMIPKESKFVKHVRLRSCTNRETKQIQYRESKTNSQEEIQSSNTILFNVVIIFTKVFLLWIQELRKNLRCIL